MYKRVFYSSLSIPAPPAAGAEIEDDDNGLAGLGADSKSDIPHNI